MYRANNFMDPRLYQPYSFARSSGHIISGHNEMTPRGNGYLNVGKIYGSGFEDMKAGLLPGEHLVPDSHVQRAVMAYKHANGLHPRGPIPASHVMKIIDQAHRASKLNPHDPHVRGGFLPALLPLLSGTLLPLAGKALGALGMGALGTLGGIAARKVTGTGLMASHIVGSGMDHHHHYFHHGLPRRVVGPNREVYWHLHGEGFRDWIGRAYRHVKRIATSEPVRMVGAHALNSVKDALVNALVGKINGYTGDLVERLGGKRPGESMNIATERALAKSREAQSLDPPSYDETTTVLGNDDSRTPNDMMPRGSGMKRKAPARGGRPKRRQTQYMGSVY